MSLVRISGIYSLFDKDSIQIIQNLVSTSQLLSKSNYSLESASFTSIHAIDS